MWIGDLQWQGALGDGTVLLLAELVCGEAVAMSVLLSTIAFS